MLTSVLIHFKLYIYGTHCVLTTYHVVTSHFRKPLRSVLKCQYVQKYEEKKNEEKTQETDFLFTLGYKTQVRKGM